MCSITDLCFMCSNDNKCNVVDNKIVTQVEYLIPEIDTETHLANDSFCLYPCLNNYETIIKLRLPLHICSFCEKNLQFFNTFKQTCVQNSLRLEARIKEAQDNTDLEEKCSTSETNIHKLHEVYIKEEVFDESDTATVKDFFADEISMKHEFYLKENRLQEDLNACEVGDIQDITKEESPLQTDTHLHEDSSVHMDGESAQNSVDATDVSVYIKMNSDENILVTDSPGRKMYTCLICKKGFKELRYLKKYHMKIHIGDTNFQCNECKKCFLQNSHLTSHMKQHTGVKDFQCEECKKCFLRNSDLVRHMKTHSEVKDFECKECNRCFIQKSTFVTHMKRHTGVKDFECKECKKCFVLHSTLVRHMKQHTGVKDFQCEECKKWFLQKSTLVTHMKLHTREKD